MEKTSFVESICHPGSYPEILLGYEGVLAAPFWHLGGGQGGVAASFFGLGRPFGAHGSAQGRPREAQGCQKWRKRVQQGCQMASKVVPGATFVEICETLECDDSTTFFKGC